jgi:hypothetical protein
MQLLHKATFPPVSLYMDAYVELVVVVVVVVVGGGVMFTQCSV